MAGSTPIYDTAGEEALMLDLWTPEIKDDPRNFVRYAYPWGEPGSPLEHLKGPRKWQDDVMGQIAEYIKSAPNQKILNGGVLPEMYRQAIASGRGIGKSALFGWLAHWMVSTRIGSSVWVAANGEPQLKTKTFPEIAKWVTMGANAHWFDINITSIVPAKWFAELVKKDWKVDDKYWYIQAQLWSKENPDAFAGAHNVLGEMALFDEASGIPPAIWTVQQGVFTEEIVDRYWLAFSNPRQNSGAFFECFHKNFETLWPRSIKIDARTVEGGAKDVAQAIIAEHGADSNEARIEVYGEFPDMGQNQFIGMDVVQAAQKRDVIPDPGAPLLLGVDVARGQSTKSAKSVIAVRKGREARFFPWFIKQGIDTVALASQVADMAIKLKADAIFVDGNGVGGGVVDNLKAWKFNVIEVQAGGSANEEDRFVNKRVEMWANLRDWLPTGAIPASAILQSDLVGPQYSYHPSSNKLVLESKDSMLERGLASPDEGEALALTFARPVARNDIRASRTNSNRSRMARDVDYQMFG